MDPSLTCRKSMYRVTSASELSRLWMAMMTLLNRFRIFSRADVSAQKSSSSRMVTTSSQIVPPAVCRRLSKTGLSLRMDWTHM